MPDSSLCPGCFLSERRGVCPVAHPGYDWQQAVRAYRQAEELRRAVLEDAEQASAGLIELVRQEAVEKSPASPTTAAPAALPPGMAPGTVETNPKKEEQHVHAAGSLWRR